MSRTKTPDLGQRIAEQRDQLTESVNALADKIDTDEIRGRITDTIDALPTEEILGRAEAGASQLLDSATDDQGKPKRGVLVGLLVGAVALVLVRKLLK